MARFVSDFSEINEWTIDSHNAAHQADLQWLNSQIFACARHEPHRSIVALTHYSPTVLEEADDPKHVKDNYQIRSAFSTDLSDQLCWTNPQVKLWAFGHTHFNCDMIDPQTKKRIVGNQKGYWKAESLSFSGTKIVDIDIAPLHGQKGLNNKNDVQEAKKKREHCIMFGQLYNATDASARIQGVRQVSPKWECCMQIAIDPR